MKNYLILALALGLLAQPAMAFGFKWKSVLSDGSRTGVTAPLADNVDKALGHFEGRTYVAPNGRRFPKRSSAAKAAKLMIEAQPAIADLKEVVGYCPEGMVRKGDEATLELWVVDMMMEATEKAAGKKVDIGIMNHGGIRVDMPQGDVLKDDIMSMLPFKNYLCYLTMSGENLISFFNSMADHMQIVGGAKVTLQDGKVKELLIGGQPVERGKTYGIATIDFLLDGGDDIFVARDADSLVQTDVMIFDAANAYLKAIASEGKMIEKEFENRVVEL